MQGQSIETISCSYCIAIRHPVVMIVAFHSQTYDIITLLAKRGAVQDSTSNYGVVIDIGSIRIRDG